MHIIWHIDILLCALMKYKMIFFRNKRHQAIMQIEEFHTIKLFKCCCIYWSCFRREDPNLELKSIAIKYRSCWCENIGRYSIAAWWIGASFVTLSHSGVSRLDASPQLNPIWMRTNVNNIRIRISIQAIVYMVIFNVVT